MSRTRQLVARVMGVVVLMAGAGHAAGGTVIPISATSNMGNGFGTDLTNTINGSGLASFPSLSAIHSGTSPINSWVSAGTTVGTIDFTLNGTFQINGFSIWNQNNGGPGTAGSTGIQDVTLSTSLNGSTFLPLEHGPTKFAQVTAMTAAPEVFSFAPTSAKVIRFNVTSNYGDVQTGFAEIAFSDVPEPSFVAVLGIGLLPLAARWRRRIRAVS